MGGSSPLGFSGSSANCRYGWPRGRDTPVATAWCRGGRPHHIDQLILVVLNEVGREAHDFALNHPRSSCPADVIQSVAGRKACSERGSGWTSRASSPVAYNLTGKLLGPMIPVKESEGQGRWSAVANLLVDPAASPTEACQGTWTSLPSGRVVEVAPLA